MATTLQLDRRQISDLYLLTQGARVPLTGFQNRECAEAALESRRKTCPHLDEDPLELSGSEVRRMLRRGELPPAEFSRPEVAAILARYYGNGAGGVA